MIRDKNYKMIIYPVANVVRLYDIKNDPWELTDLAGDAKHKPLMDRMMERFKQLQVQVGDPLDVTQYYLNFFSKQ